MKFSEAWNINRRIADHVGRAKFIDIVYWLCPRNNAQIESQTGRDEKRIENEKQFVWIKSRSLKMIRR